MKLYQHLAGLLLRRDNTQVDDFSRNHLPSGSGIDSGCKVDLVRSTPNRVVVSFGYHHMDDGSYNGWTHHELIITPDLRYGFKIRITGPDRNQTKEYLYDLFYNCLNEEIEL